MEFAGKPASLRQWAASRHLPEAPDPVRAAFLGAAPGKVFDASSEGAKLALLSSDDGICAVVTEHVGDSETQQALEHVLTEAGVRFRLVIERNDRDNPKLHHREYLATRDGRSWRILAATVRDAAPGQAMLTAAPE